MYSPGDRVGKPQCGRFIVAQRVRACPRVGIFPVFGNDRWPQLDQPGLPPAMGGMADRCGCHAAAHVVIREYGIDRLQHRGCGTERHIQRHPVPFLAGGFGPFFEVVAHGR